jgi:hypothetical protein
VASKFTLREWLYLLSAVLVSFLAGCGFLAIVGHWDNVIVELIAVVTTFGTFVMTMKGLDSVERGRSRRHLKSTQPR